MSKAIIIEQRNVERDYGFRGVEAIVEHEKHGRLLVCDGFGGKDSLRGGAVRFEHGMVCKLHDDDTFEQLDADWNDYTTVNSAVQSGYDGSRPVLDWSGHVIAGLAKSCGLDCPRPVAPAIAGVSEWRYHPTVRHTVSIKWSKS